MDVFNFPMHRVSSKYPQTGLQIELGNSYVFTTAPEAPPARTFTLSFTGFAYYVNADGSIDATTNADKNNMAALEAFYVAHKLHASFIYPHRVYGNVVCKFRRPLEVPEGIPNGFGTLEDFQLEMVELPGG